MDKDTKSQIIANQNIPSVQQNRKRGNPAWKKGMESPNPAGPGISNIKLNSLFTKAFLEDKDKNKGLDLFQYAFQRARKDDGVLKALLNKFMPDLIKGEGFGDSIRAQIFEGLDGAAIRAFITRGREVISEERSF